MDEYDLTGINLPFDKVAEDAVIGAVIGKGELIGDIVNKLKPEHFFDDRNREIYGIMVQLFSSNDVINSVTVGDLCAMHGVFAQAVEAKAYLLKALNDVPSISAIAKYADIVREKALRRSLIFASKEIIDMANTSPDTSDAVVDFAEQKIFDIRTGAESSDLTHISGVVYDRVRAFSELVAETDRNGGKPAMKGLATGFTEVDKRIFGLNKSDLIILAARPGMGKTSFAMNIAVNVAKRFRDKQICVFSLEMSKEQIVSRMLCAEAMISSDEMQTGRSSPEHMNNVMTAADVLQHLEIYIDDTPGCNVTSIKSKLRRMKNLGVVIIDYLQLMSSTNNYRGNRVVEMSEITRSLKIMAKELNVPVIALSQLARGPEQRPDKRPMLSDLRDSGSIEQDADIVLFLYRNSYYDKTDPNQNLCECIVAKNRHGETGTADLGWIGECTKFTNVEVRREQQGGYAQ